MSILDLRHPVYTSGYENWVKWRDVYEGGDYFVNNYLEKFSEREDSTDFARRKKLTPIPTFAKTAINEIRNSIFQRLADVSRKGGSDTYQEAVKGQKAGVDNRGRSMTSYIGQELLSELLVMGKVGCYVDAPEQVPTTLGAPTTDTFKPYVYRYRVEDIVNWKRGRPENPSEFTSLVLRETDTTFDDVFNLPNGTTDRYRHVWIDPTDGFVRVQFSSQPEINEKGDVTKDGIGEVKTLKLKKIPFVLMDLGDSLMKDVANHQIALLNLWSSNVSYGMNSNFPFYVEQRDTRAIGGHLKPAANSDGTATAGGQGSNDEKIEVGNLKGRAYGMNSEAPAFINPSSEPLMANMTMCDKLKDEVRQLVSLAVANMGTQASAESKNADQQGLEAGLSFIGLVLEAAEREIAEHWAMYENASNPNEVIIEYPTRWNLKTNTQRVEEATVAYDASLKVPGQTAKKEASKLLISSLIGNKVSAATLNKIHDEIDSAEYTTSDPAVIEMAREQGLVGDKTGTMALGFNPEEAIRAQDDHIKKLAEIQKAQTSPDSGGSDDDDDDVQGLDQSTADAKKQKADEKADTDGTQQSKAQRGKQKRFKK